MTDDVKETAGLIPSELVQQDEEFAYLVEAFLNRIPERIGQLETALAEQNFEALRSCAHQLKGSGGGYGYPMLTTCAARLEQQAVAAELQACQAGVEELKNLVSRLVLRA